MTPPTDLAALAERVERATGPSRELDKEVASAIDPLFPREFIRMDPDIGPVREGWQWARKVTSSIDAALRLMPADRMWFLGHLDPTDMRFSATITLIGHIGVTEWRAVAATPALALCAAALRARSAQP